MSLRSIRPRLGYPILLCLTALSACGGPPEVQLSPTTSPAPASYAYRTLGDLCDTVGHRLAGSPQMQQAVSWAVGTLNEAGFDSVWTEPVTIPHWERGREWARCTAPVPSH